MKKILTLRVKGEYWHQVKAGEKLEEYRLQTGYWIKRLCGKVYDEIHYILGYPKNGTQDAKDKTLVYPWRGFSEKTMTHKQFGPLPADVYAIRLKA